MSGQKYATCSIIIHSIYYLKNKLKTSYDCATSNQLQKNLVKSLDFYLIKYKLLNNRFLCCSTFLNPDYRNLNLCNIEERDEIKRQAIQYIKSHFNKQIIGSVKDSESQIPRSESNLSDNSFYGGTKESENDATSSKSISEEKN